MTYGELQRLMLTRGGDLEEIATDAAFNSRLKDYVAAIKAARKQGIPADYAGIPELMALTVCLMRDHAAAMTRLICQTQGITEQELRELSEQETIGKFTETFKEVLRPFFTLSALMA